MPLASVSTMAHRMRRTILAGAATALALALTTACTPDPAPSPTPTGFASEEDAFAAAEATYRAYVDAGNEARKDPTHQPTPDSFLTGKALTDSLEGQRLIEESGVHLVGGSTVQSVRLNSWEPEAAVITVCLDLTHVRVFNEDGVDVTPSSRGDVGILEVTVISAQPKPLIIQSQTGQGPC